MYVKRMILFLALVFLFVSCPVSWANEDSIKEDPLQSAASHLALTSAEQAWLNEHTTIRIGGMAAWPPLNFLDADHRPSGLGADYVRAMNRLLGGRLELISGPFESNEQHLRGGQLDAMMDITPTQDRRNFFRFTRPYLTIPHVIVAKKGGRYYAGESDLTGKTLALESGFYNIIYFKENYPDIRIQVYEDTSHALDAVVRGEADAYAGNRAVVSHIMAQELMSSLELQGRLRKPASVLTIGVDKASVALAGILDKALGALPWQERLEIHRKWTGLTENPGIGPQLQLSSEEASWIQSNQQVRVCSVDNPPFGFFNREGEPSGISVDILKLAAERAGLNLDISIVSLNTLMSRFEAGEADLVLGVGKTSARAVLMGFSPSYLSISTAIYVSEKDYTAKTIADLFGKTVAVQVKSHFWEVLVRQQPETLIIPVESPLAGLEAVRQGRADAFVGNEMEAQAQINKWGLKNIRKAGYWNGLKDELRMGVSLSEPLFSGIIKKTLETVTTKEKQRIYDQYAMISRPAQEAGKIPPGKELKTLAIYGILVCLVVAILFFVLIKAAGKESVATHFGSFGFRVAVVAGLFVFIFTVVGLEQMVSQRNRHLVLNDVGAQISMTASLIHDRARMWLEERHWLMTRLGMDPRLLEITRELLQVTPKKEALVASTAVARVREFFETSRNIFPHTGFFIINSEGINIATLRNENLGDINLIMDRYPELVEKAFGGTTVFVPPITSDIRIAGSGKVTPPTMFFLSPLQELDGSRPAVMAMRIDPLKDLGKLTHFSGPWETMDIYLFDSRARMLSPSRYEDQLVEAGLLKPGESSAMTHSLTLPGGDITKGFKPDLSVEKRTLTRMAEKALEIRRQMRDLKIDHGVTGVGVDTRGYADYRGVDVVGAWLWDMDMDVGFAAEIDRTEALKGYDKIRFTVLAGLGGTLVLSVLSVLLVVVFGERTSRTLKRARDHLESQVAQRTAALLKTTERFEALMESAPDALVVFDQQGKIVLINSRTEKLLACDRSKILGYPIGSLMAGSEWETHPEHGGNWLTSAAVWAKGLINAEMYVMAKNQRRIPVDVTLSPLEEVSGRQVVASLRDITARKAADAALRTSEEKFRLILESVGEGIFGVDHEGCVSFVNASAETLLGYEADELIGLSLHDTIHHSRENGSPYPSGECLLCRTHLQEGQKVIRNEWLWRKDGSKFPVEYTAVPLVKEDEVAGAVLTFRDITLRKRVEQAMEEERLRLQHILATSPVGVAFTVNGLIRLANPKFVEMFGVSVGDGIPDIYVNAEEREFVLRQMEMGRRVENAEFQFYGQEKDIRSMLVTYIPLSFQDTPGILGWALDITDRKKVEQQIEDRLDELTRFRRLAVDREQHMIRLKEEINALRVSLGQKPQYRIVPTPTDGSENL